MKIQRHQVEVSMAASDFQGVYLLKYSPSVGSHISAQDHQRDMALVAFDRGHIERSHHVVDMAIGQVLAV